jgi:hypothetical protein
LFGSFGFDESLRGDETMVGESAEDVIPFRLQLRELVCGLRSEHAVEGWGAVFPVLSLLIIIVSTGDWRNQFFSLDSFEGVAVAEVPVSESQGESILVLQANPWCTSCIIPGRPGTRIMFT